ncbi:hypothetical protein J6590_015603 [Homalodisca vitripennis]|nr:hypothetical protein J6590_015603 [Homalodisca vitripennis]
MDSYEVNVDLEAVDECHARPGSGRRPSSRPERGVTDYCTFGTVASRAVCCGVHLAGDLAPLPPSRTTHLLHHYQRA